MAEKQERKRKYSRKEISDLKKAFQVFDKDDDGTIDAAELGGVLGILGVKVNKRELKQMIKRVDSDGNGTVDFPEFVQYMCKNSEPINEELELREAFKVFDTNEDGHITAVELKSVLKKMDSTLSDELIQKMVLDIDTNGDGVIDYEEFAKIAVTAGQEDSDEEEDDQDSDRQT